MLYVTSRSIEVPALGFGTYQLKGAIAREMVRAALDIGFRHIDTAQLYDNEKDVGLALRASGIERHELFLTTKVWSDRFAWGDLQRSVEESLDRLGLESIDLLLLHWPNPHIPLEETLRALAEVQENGWARQIGVSNFNTALLEQVESLIPERIISNQVEYHPLLKQRSVLDWVQEHQIMMTAYSPLAQGKIIHHPVIKQIAARHGKNPGQIALRWLLQQAQVTAIPRSSSIEHARDNFNIFDFQIDADEMEKISSLGSPNGRLLNLPGYAPQWDAE